MISYTLSYSYRELTEVFACKARGFLPVRGTKYIKYDWENRANPENCFVQDRDSFMGLVRNEKGWKSSIEGKEYSAKLGELVVEHWLWVEKVKNGSVNHEHFRLKGWDPIANSPTVQNGKVDGYRVFRKAA